MVIDKETSNPVLSTTATHVKAAATDPREANTYTTHYNMATTLTCSAFLPYIKFTTTSYL